MKKTLSIIILALTVIIGGATSEAKTTSKKSSSSSAPAITAKFSDGHPNIVGHSYTKTEQGVKMVLTFNSMYEATLKLSKGNQSESFTTDWEYEGDGFLVVEAIDGSYGNGLVLFIGDNGRKLYLSDDYGDVQWNYGPFKLIK